MFYGPLPRECTIVQHAPQGDETVLLRRRSLVAHFDNDRTVEGHHIKTVWKYKLYKTVSYRKNTASEARAPKKRAPQNVLKNKYNIPRFQNKTMLIILLLILRFSQAFFISNKAALQANGSN